MYRNDNRKLVIRKQSVGGESWFPEEEHVRRSGRLLASDTVVVQGQLLGRVAAGPMALGADASEVDAGVDDSENGAHDYQYDQNDDHRWHGCTRLATQQNDATLRFK